MKNRFVLSLAILASAMALFTPQMANAEAGLEEQGKGEVITTFRIYQTTRFFDYDGNKQSIPRFTKTELNPYYEYGILDNLTLGGELDLATANNQSPQFNDVTKVRASYCEIFARMNLYKQSNFVASVEPGVDFPQVIQPDLISDGNKPIPELKLDFGYGFKDRGLDHFVDTSVKYARRDSGDLRDMIKSEATLGYRIDEQFMALAQVSDEQTLGGLTQPGNYNLVKPQFSVLYQPEQSNFTHQLGAFSNVYGESTRLAMAFSTRFGISFNKSSKTIQL